MYVAGQDMIDERGGGRGFVDLPWWGCDWERLWHGGSASPQLYGGGCLIVVTAMDGRERWGRRGLLGRRSRGGD